MTGWLIRSAGILNVPPCGDGTGGLVIQGERVAAIGRFEELKKAWPGFPLQDWGSLYIMPGLVNTHVHLEFAPEGDTLRSYLAVSGKERAARGLRAARAMLLSGVTTVRDAGSSMALVEAVRSSRDQTLPHLLLCGPPLTKKGGHLWFMGGEADTAEELERQIRARRREGCRMVKVIASGGRLTPGSKPWEEQYCLEELRAAVKVAHGEGLSVMAHCLTERSAVMAVQAGVDCIEHFACIERRGQEIARRFRKETAAGLERWLRRREYFLMAGLSNSCPAMAGRLRREGRKKGAFWKEERRRLNIAEEVLGLGFTPVAGTDGGCPGTYFEETWMEAALLAESGILTAQEALAAVTVNGARALGVERETGRIKPGFYADLIALEGNPERDIRALSRVRHVVCRGRLIR